MLTLYFSPGACSLAAHIILEELQIPYDTVKVDLKNHTYDSGQDYYKINPMGSVPVLKLDDGKLITQNAAILPYLGDLDPQHQLLPKFGTMDRVRANEWLAFLNSDFHKAFGPCFGPDKYVTSAGAKEELKRTAEKNIKKIAQIVDKKLPVNQYALGEHFSIIDAYLFVLFQWLKHLNIATADLPNYSALAIRIAERPAVKRVLEQEGLVKGKSNS